MPPVPPHPSTDSLDDPHRFVGRVLDDRYRLLAAIGRGASATVFQAEDTRLRRRVAVKTLQPALADDPKFRRRFRAEAHAAAQLSHQHLLAVYDWGDREDLYLVTELLSGGSLRSMIQADHRLSPSQALVIGLHAAEGLGHVHSRGFVHRDVKPANLLFGADGRLRVADFGIARAVAEAAWTEPEGVLIGTARYAAPEQASGGPIDGSADVYSLAVTLVEAVTGEVPMVESSPLATMVRRQDEDMPEIEALGPLAPIVAAAGQADPQRRPDARTFVRALNSAANQLPRPTRLPLVGITPIEIDSALPRIETDRLEPERFEAETGVLVLGDDRVDASIDLTPSAGLAMSRSLDDSGPELFDQAPLEEAADVQPLVEQDDLSAQDELGEPVVGRGRLFAVLGLILLAAAVIGAIVFGPGAIDDVQPIPTHDVEQYVGQDLDTARASIEANGWILTEPVTERRQDGTDVGEVLEQAPASGTSLEEGATITLVVSVGPEVHIVPDLTGLTRAEAVAAIGEAGLALGTVDSEQFDEEVPAGFVIAASVEAGVELETGSTVDLVVSAGPEPRPTPDLSGLTPAEAEAALVELGLVMVAGQEHSTTVAEGLVITTVPAPGELVEREGTVEVIVSLGLPFITVPDVVGLSATEAADRLTAAGFVVTGTDGNPNKEVLITDPPAGETYRLGHGVRIVTRN